MWIYSSAMIQSRTDSNLNREEDANHQSPHMHVRGIFICRSSPRSVHLRSCAPFSRCRLARALFPANWNISIRYCFISLRWQTIYITCAWAKCHAVAFITSLSIMFRQSAASTLNDSIASMASGSIILILNEFLFIQHVSHRQQWMFWC